MLVGDCCTSSLGHDGAAVSARRKLAQHDLRCGIHGEHESVGGVSQREDVPEDEKEPIECDHAGDRNWYGLLDPEEDCDSHHGEEIEDPKYQHGKIRPQEP